MGDFALSLSIGSPTSSTTRSKSCAHNHGAIHLHQAMNFGSKVLGLDWMNAAVTGLDDSELARFDVFARCAARVFAERHGRFRALPAIGQ